MKKKLLSPSIGYIPPCLGELGEKYRHTHAGAVLPKLNCTRPKKKEPTTNFRQGKSLVPRPGEKKKNLHTLEGTFGKNFPQILGEFRSVKTRDITGGKRDVCQVSRNCPNNRLSEKGVHAVTEPYVHNHIHIKQAMNNREQEVKNTGGVKRTHPQNSSLSPVIFSPG